MYISKINIYHITLKLTYKCVCIYIGFMYRQYITAYNTVVYKVDIQTQSVIMEVIPKHNKHTYHEGNSFGRLFDTKRSQRISYKRILRYQGEL